MNQEQFFSHVAMVSSPSYNSQNFRLPLQASLPTGFNRSSPSAQRNFSYQQPVFQLLWILLWSKWDTMAGWEEHLLHCKSESVTSCSGFCDKTRSRGRTSRWCVSIRPWRGNVHIWCALYLLPALLLDESRLSPSASSAGLVKLQIYVSMWDFRVWSVRNATIFIDSIHRG